MSEQVTEQRVPDQSVFPLEGFNGKLSGGLTKRELLAAMSMHALISSQQYGYGGDANEPKNGEWAAEIAVGFADALLRELAK